MTKRGDQIKTNFEYFQIQKWMLQTVWAEKVDKKWRDLSSFDVPILSYGPQIVWKNSVFAILCWPQQEI